MTPSADHVKPLKNWRALFFLQQLPSCASGDFVTVYQTGYQCVFLWGGVYVCVGSQWSHHLWEWNLTNSVCRSRSKWKCGDDHEAWPHAVTINLLKRTTTKTEIFVVCVLVIITSVLGVCAAQLSAAGGKIEFLYLKSVEVGGHWGQGELFHCWQKKLVWLHLLFFKRATHLVAEHTCDLWPLLPTRLHRSTTLRRKRSSGSGSKTSLAVPSAPTSRKAWKTESSCASKQSLHQSSVTLNHQGLDHLFLICTQIWKAHFLSFFPVLSLLCRLINRLQPGSVRKINQSALNWHQVSLSYFS